MNCKPGDLAIVVKAPREVRHQIGRIVRVVSLTTSWDFVPCWRLEEPFWDVVNGVRARCEAIADRDLMPIRDNDGEDEMLRIVGKPEPLSA